MTFSEYFNALYPYLADGDKPVDFFDKMIEHFIHAEALDACQLLDRPHDTKARYIKKSTPNKIKSDYAQYVYSKHNSQRYRKWLDARMCALDIHYKIEEWLNDKDIEFYDVCAACDDLLETIFLNIASPEESGVKIPEKETADGAESSQLSDNDKELLKDFHIDFDSILEKRSGYCDSLTVIRKPLISNFGIFSLPVTAIENQDQFLITDARDPRNDGDRPP